MGMARETIFLLLRLQKKGYLNSASVLQLGRQSGIVSYRQMNRIGKRFDRKFSQKKRDNYDFYRNYPSGDEIFQLLGFNSIQSLDSNEYEGATFTHDLNKPLLEKNFGEFDLVYDGGTTEHIFDQITVLANIYKLLKIGGIVIHHTPANNFLDHGYFQPSPSFYYEYYLANGFELIDSFLVESTYDFYRKRKVYDYKPLMYEKLSYGGWGNKMIGNWFVFKKLSQSTSGLIPQQQRYTNLFYVNSKPEKSENQYYNLIVKYFNSHPKFKYNILQSKHWFLKILKISKYLKTQKGPKPIFRA